MTCLELDVNVWAVRQFGDCELGDVRRTRRLVTFAAQVAADPDASTPQQSEGWADCRAAYRLLDQQEVTFEAVVTPHWQQTRARQGGRWLVIGDTTTIDFGAQRNVAGLSAVGNGGGRGFLLHSGLMIDAESEAIVGLAGGVIHYRQPVPKGESFRQRLARDRESRVWGQVIQQVGPPAEGTQFIHLFDRGADNFEVYCHLLLNRGDWVVRAAQLKRRVQVSGEQTRMKDYLGSLPLAGTYDLHLRSTQKQPARIAHLEVRFGNFLMPKPRDAGKFVKECGIAVIGMNVVEVREVDAPPGVQPLHWVLYTSLPIHTFEDAWQAIAYYEKRPLIEEFHKAIKTGCRLEQRQYRTTPRLEAVTGVLCVAAVRLLQLRAVARSEPQRPAEHVVPKRWVKVLGSVRRRGKPIRTVRDFFRALAQLGGFLGRKCDGEPGWITLWRGFEKLQLILRGTECYAYKCGKC